MVFIASFRAFPVYAGLAVGALAINALFILRVVQKTFYGPVKPALAGLGDLAWPLNTPRVILAAAIVLFGLMPAWLFDMIQTASEPLIAGLPQ
jgi:NADH-quinone oxidoreductase subunit M